MNYIFLAIIITAVILIIYLNFYKIKEGLEFNEQQKYLKKQDNYYDHRKFPQVVKGSDAESKFVKLTTNKEKLEKSKPAKQVEQSELSKKIEKCKLVNRTKDCSYLTENDSCGYCWDTDKILYGDKNGPKEDVCSKKGWVAPGPQSSYFCTKMKEQAICRDVKDCGDTVGEKSICGWCPLTGKGIVKKKVGNGWVPKYADDGKCDWRKDMEKNSTKATSKFLGWFPSKLRIGVPLDAGEGDCDTDADCGKTPAGVQMKCGHDGRNMKNIVDSKGNPLKPNQGWKDYCYDPSDPKPVFEGVLIEAKDCEKFKQMFPCVGRNMFTGPHSNECLESLWNKSGCSGNLFSRVTDNVDFNNWSKVSYIDVQNNMNTIKIYAKNDKNYNIANNKHMQCFGTPVNPCQARFKPRPMECNKKIYNSIGCSLKGKLNPEKESTWPDGYVANWWKSVQKFYSQWYYKSNLRKYKREADYYKRNPKANYDKAIETNMLCYGSVPDIPYEKPCWKDFTNMMTATEYIKMEPDGSLNFDSNSGGGFKRLLPLTNRASGWNKEQNISWSSNKKSSYILTRETYVKKYFPFWNFVELNKSIWNTRWNHFKHLMLKARNISDKTSKIVNAQYMLKDSILIKNTAFFDIVPSTASLSRANREGHLYRTSEGYFLNKKMFMHQNFPYWSFIRTAKIN